MAVDRQVVSPGITGGYSRCLDLQFATELEPGDLVDIATILTPYWVEVDRVGVCDDDPGWDAHCADPDACLAVVFYVDRSDPEGGPWQWHVTDTDEIRARVRVAVDWAADELAAENEAHRVDADGYEHDRNLNDGYGFCRHEVVACARCDVAADAAMAAVVGAYEADGDLDAAS
jgi:hypothetical protein